MLWSLNKFSQLILWEMYGYQCGEFLCGYWGMKGYVIVVHISSSNNDNYWSFLFFSQPLCSMIRVNMGKSSTYSLFMIWNDTSDKVRVGVVQDQHEFWKLFLETQKRRRWWYQEATKGYKMSLWNLHGKNSVTLYNWLTVRNIPFRTLLPNGVSLCAAFMLTMFSIKTANVIDKLLTI